MDNEQQKLFKDSIDIESKKIQTEYGYLDFWTPKKGENKIEVTHTPIRTMVFEGKQKKILRVKVDGVLKDWSLNPFNPIYSELIKSIGEGKTEFTVIREGDSTNTRYKLL